MFYELNDLITIESLKGERDKVGGMVESWQKVATVWSKVTFAKQISDSSGQIRRNYTIYLVKVRNGIAIQKGMRILYADKILYISRILAIKQYVSFEALEKL